MAKRYKPRLNWKSNEVKINVICILLYILTLVLFMSVSCEWFLRVKILPSELFSASLLSYFRLISVTYSENVHRAYLAE
jgi:hypothetical protein